MTTRKNRIQEALEILKPQILEIIDESHLHAKHYTGDMSDATHIKIKIKSAKLSELKLADQHRAINSLLHDELQNGLHALSIKIIK